MEVIPGTNGIYKTIIHKQAKLLLLGRGDFGYICVSHRFINKSETVVLLRKEEVIITYSDGILIW